ncbi:hypothetical protein Tco_0478727 [Tanacetum coccineum]
MDNKNGAEGILYYESQPKGGTKSNANTGTTGVDRQHDGMHCTPSYASFLHEESSQERILCKKYGVKKVMGDKNSFFFIQLSCPTSLEWVLKHGPWLIRNVPFILRKWIQVLSCQKRNLLPFLCGSNFMVFLFRNLVQMGLVLSPLVFAPPFRVLVMQSLGRMDYARALVDIRAHRALKDTIVISIPNPIGNGVTMHKCPKRVIADLRNLRKQGETFNDGFQTVQRKSVRDPLVNKHGTGGNHSLPKQQDDNGKPMDELVDGSR